MASAPWDDSALRRLDQLGRDEEDYLLDAQDWSPDLAAPLAAECGLELTAERGEIIAFIRGSYEERATVPEARTLLRHLGKMWGPERASRRHLYRLFPRGYDQQACKIAGMTRPRKLRLDV